MDNHSDNTKQQQQQQQTTKALPVHVNMNRSAQFANNNNNNTSFSPPPLSKPTVTGTHARSNSTLMQTHRTHSNPVVVAGPVAHLKAQQRPYTHARTMSGTVTQPLQSRALLPTTAATGTAAAAAANGNTPSKLVPIVLSPTPGHPQDCFRLQMSGGNRLTSHRRACSVSGDMDLPFDNNGLTFASQIDGTYIPGTSPGGVPSGAASPVPACGDISEFVNYALATPCAPSPMGTVRHHAGANESPAVAAYYGGSGEYASYSPYVYDRSPSPGIVPQIPMLQQQQQQQQQMMMLSELSEEEDGEKRRRTYTFFKERIESGRLMVQTDYPELSEMVNDSQKREQLGSVVGKAYGFLFDKKRFKLNNKTEESPFDFSKSPTGLLSYIPPSNIHRFVERIAKYVPLSAEALVLSLIYIDFLMERGILDVNSKNAQRVFATAFVTASKFAYDRVYSNKFYAKVTYLEVTELDDLEIEFLKLFKFNVTPSLDDWNSYASWIYSVAFPTTRPSPMAGLPYSPPLSPSSSSSPAAAYYQQQQQQQNAIPQSQNTGVPTPFQLHPILGSSYSGQSQLSSVNTANCGNSASSALYQDNLSFKNSQSPSKNNSITESPIKNNIKLNTENNKKHHKKSHKKRSAKNPDEENSSSSSSSGSCSGSSQSSSGSSGSCSGSSRSSGSGSGSCSESCSGSSQSGSGTGSGSCSGSSSVTSSGSSTSSVTSSGSASSGSGSVISRSTTSSGSTTSSVLSNECRWNGKNPISVGESEGDLDESPVIERSKSKNTVDVLGTVRVIEGGADDDDDESSEDFDDCEVIVHDTENEEEETVDVADGDDDDEEEEEEEEVVESEKSVGGI